MWIDHGRGALLTRRGRQHVHRLRRRHRLPERRPRAPARREGRAASRRQFLHTDFTIVPYESYVALAERLLPLVPISGRQARGVLQLGRRGGRERGQDREGRHRPPRGDRVRGGVPRPHAHGDVADLEGAPVQGRLRAVRARGLPRAVPERATRSARTPPQIALDDLRRALRRRASRPRSWPRSSSSPSRARAASCRRRAEYLRGLREICDEHGIVLIADEVQSGFGRTGTHVRDGAVGRRARPGLRREVDRRRACRSRACSAARRSWTRPATPTIGGTFVGNPVGCEAALAVLDVIAGEDLLGRARAIGETVRAPPTRRCRPACRRSATSAAWARCSASSSSARATRAPDAGSRPAPSSRAAAGPDPAARPA